MAANYVVKALFIFLFIVSLSAGNSDDLTRDLLDHVLRIPNPERILNSVLGRLERNRQQGFNPPQPGSVEPECIECSESLPEYSESLQTSRERGLRQLGIQKHYPICHLERKIKKLNTNDYEYRPAYYEEVRCSTPSGQDEGATNEICSSLGFSCVQWNKTIHLTRRRYNSDCWETRTMVVPAGCECMWPVHKLGEMKQHV